MSRQWIIVLCILIVTNTIYGNTGSKNQETCPIKCDLLQNIQLLQQQMTQETIVRLGLDAQVQDLRKSFTDVVKQLQDTIHVMNKSLEEKGSFITKLQENEHVMNKSLEERGAFITELQKENTDIKQTLQTLKTQG